MTDEKKEHGFTVTDRRIKDEGGGEAQAPAGAEAAPAAPAQGTAAEEKGKSGKTQGPALGPVTFPTFLLSLHTAVLFHLGLLAAKETEKVEVDLAAARQNIDILEILEAKTKGNLTPEEADLLTNILYESRMAYVQVCELVNKGECQS